MSVTCELLTRDVESHEDNHRVVEAKCNVVRIRERHAPLLAGLQNRQSCKQQHQLSL